MTVHCLLCVGETNLSAQEAQTRANARIPREEKKHEGTKNTRSSTPQGPRASLGVMSKTQRLTRADFALMGRARRQIHGTLFSLSVFKLPEAAEGLKFACVVSKKASPKAVERNRLKRRCRECAHQALEKFNAPLALVFRAKKGSGGTSHASICRDVQALVEKLINTGHTPQ